MMASEVAAGRDAVVGRPMSPGRADLSDLPRPDRDVVTRPAFRPVLRQAMRRIIDAEGPMFESEVVRRIVDEWGLRPISARVASELAQTAHGRVTTTEGDRTLVWPDEVPPTARVDFRHPVPGGRRECADVPMVELIDLARLVADHRVRGSQRAMAAELGYSALHPKVAGRLDEALRAARALGYVSTQTYPR